MASVRPGWELSVPSHGLLKPPCVLAEVDVDSGFLGVSTHTRTPRDDALETPITHERSPGVTLAGVGPAPGFTSTNHVGGDGVGVDAPALVL